MDLPKPLDRLSITDREFIQSVRRRIARHMAVCRYLVDGEYRAQQMATAHGAIQAVTERLIESSLSPAEMRYALEVLIVLFANDVVRHAEDGIGQVLTAEHLARSIWNSEHVFNFLGVVDTLPSETEAATAEPATAATGNNHNMPFPKRALWLAEELQKRAWNKHDLQPTADRITRRCKRS